jgi:hypothetical protein
MNREFFGDGDKSEAVNRARGGKQPLGALSTYRLTSPYEMRQNLDPALEGWIRSPTTRGSPLGGGSQGDPLSTLGWVVFFDILLTSLNEVQREFPFYIRHHGSRLEPQLLACYADDLHSVSSLREATVKSNCIISAFAAMFGIEFAPAKLRAITTISPPGEVVLYSREWVPIVVPFGDSAAYITSLDITYNLNRATASIFQSLCAKLRNIATVLGGRQASTTAHDIAQNVVTLPQVLYPL